MLEKLGATPLEDRVYRHLVGVPGLTVRTVGRRARQLMDAAGVNTRIQLGWQASRRGWLASTEP